jgi:hypothetical protein
MEAPVVVGLFNLEGTRIDRDWLMKEGQKELALLLSRGLNFKRLKETKLMSKRLNRNQIRLLIELLDKEIYDLCARLDPDKAVYAGQSQHDLTEGRLSQAVSAREKLIARLPESFNPLHLVKQDSQPRFQSLSLAQKFDMGEPGGYYYVVMPEKE